MARRLVAEQRHALGERLWAVYPFGSAATGAFEAGVSDVDTVAVLATDPTDDDVAALAAMHEKLVEAAPGWNDRIEVDYISARALANFRTGSWPAARISPGEPFHRIQIDKQWVLDWYHVRRSGVALYGPPPDVFVPPISHEEFVQAVREQLSEWAHITRDMKQGRRAYAVLTLCRALRVCRTGEYVSKKEAAEWAAAEVPEFRELVSDALRHYRFGPAASRPLSIAGVRRFAGTIIGLCSHVR